MIYNLGLLIICCCLMALQIVFSEKSFFKSKLLNCLTAILCLCFILATLYLTDFKYIFQNIRYIFFALLLGYFSYIMSLFIVGVKINKTSLLPFQCFKYKKLAKTAGKQILKTVFTSTYEEFLFRGAVQVTLLSLLGEPFIPVTLTVMIFTFMHCERQKAIVQIIDLALFSLILGITFYLTDCIWLVALTHVIRNSLLICFYHTGYINRIKNLKIMKKRMVLNNVRAKREDIGEN